MSTYREWFETIAFALNDSEPGHEFTRYPLNQMVAAFNEAMCVAAKYRQDLFTEVVVMKLQPGSSQDARGCGCGSVLDVIAQTDAHGGVIKKLLGARETVTKYKRNWRKPSCIRRPESDGGYVIDNADIDQNLNGRFTVDPAVPCDVEAYISVKCAQSPCELHEADTGGPMKVHCDLVAAAWHYVLAKMLAGDRYTQSAGSQSQYHYKMFFDLLGVLFRQEKMLEAPEEA